jgi:hypothetical protein
MIGNQFGCQRQVPTVIRVVLLGPVEGSRFWPHKKPVLVNGLDLQENHLVVLTSDGKRIQSFRFIFSEWDDTRLCIYFDGYEGVQLGNRKNTPLVQGENSVLLAITQLRSLASRERHGLLRE